MVMFALEGHLRFCSRSIVCLCLILYICVWKLILFTHQLYKDLIVEYVHPMELCLHSITLLLESVNRYLTFIFRATGVTLLIIGNQCNGLENSNSNIVVLNSKIN